MREAVEYFLCLERSVIMVSKVIVVTTFALTLVCILALSSLVNAQVVGQDLPSAAALLDSAKKVNVPSVGYQVSVSQRVDDARTGAAVANVPSSVGRAQFVPKKGLKRIQELDTRSADSSLGPTVIVDLGAFIDELLSYPKLTSEMVDIGGRSQYRIQGQSKNGMRECVIWLDCERKSVSRVHVFLIQKLFAEMDVEYTGLQGGFWLPSRITLRHTTDDSRVILDFSDYNFAK